MALSGRFAEIREPSLLAERAVEEVAAAPLGMQSVNPIVRLTDGRRAGRWDDPVSGITALVSGYLSVAGGVMPTSGSSAAARNLGQLYLKHGQDAFSRMDGAFCAVVFDLANDTIVIARDKLGIARTYLSLRDGTVVFSDSLRELLDLLPGRPKVDMESVRAFLEIGWVPSPHSMFVGVEKLEPGMFVVSDGKSFRHHRYYDVPHEAATLNLSKSVIAKRTRAQLDESVARGMALGGRWGSFLSGGVDSSSVVGSMAQRVPAGVATYFGGFSAHLNKFMPNPEEPAAAQLVADTFATEHHAIWLGPEAIETVPEIIEAIEEPVCDGGCIVVAAGMREAKGTVSGLMTGVAGDFLFTGERRHKVLNLLNYMRVIPDFLLKGAAWASGIWPFSSHPRISQAHFDLVRLLGTRGLSLDEMYVGFFRQASRDDLRKLFGAAEFDKLGRDPANEIKAFFARSSDLPPLAQFLYVDLKTQSTEHCVREVDTLGSHFGLDTYNPFLDSEFVDFAMKIPADQKISRLDLKVPLREAMRGRIPDSVLDRRKGGLGSPIRWWVTQADGLVAEVLSQDSIRRRGLFSSETIAQFRDATASGATDYSKLLWSLFTLEIWFREFVDA